MDDLDKTKFTSTLLKNQLIVINVGLNIFDESLQSQNVDVCHVEWKPPAGGDKETLDILKNLL